MFTLTPAELTRQLPWPGTFSWLGCPRVRSPKGQRAKEEEGKDPSKEQPHPLGSPWELGILNLSLRSSVPKEYYSRPTEVKS